jgi:hypothetical protein
VSVVIVMPRRILEALLIAGVAMLLMAPGVSAAGTASTGSNPASELWQAYPLEQTPTTAHSTAAATRTSSAQPGSTAPASDFGGGTPWIVLVLAACAVALSAATFVVLRRRHDAPPDAVVDRGPDAARAAGAPRGDAAARTAGATPGEGATARTAGATPGEGAATRNGSDRPGEAAAARNGAGPPAGPPATRDRPGPPPRAAATRSRPASRNGTRPRAPARGPICQIRWLPRGRGSCFSAVTTGDDGVERTVATSPHVEWTASTPPEDGPETQAAIRQLSKTLRADGWRPMRAKGTDFNEPQWYARRFRYPEAPAADADSQAADRSAT